LTSGPATATQKWMTAGAIILSVMSCSVGGRNGTATSDSAAGTVASQAEAESQLARFLSLSIITRAPKLGQYDSVYTCRDFETYSDSRWVADYRILAVRQQNDSLAEASAVLTTVARLVDRNGNGDYRATVRVAADTGHWRMLRSPETGRRWMVCGDAREGFTPIKLGRDITWNPAGASAEKARALADSVRKARGLPIIR
jgi:hypothetical protein